MSVIQINGKSIEEGYVLNRYFKNRMVKRNQNVLVAVSGGTGSGKSYCCLRVGELWYKEHFNKPFSIDNVCFSISEIIKLLNEGKLKKGELIIMEEGGVLLGSLDFQQKISKLFTYILQSFRSMNVGLIINLPVLSMLNKSARLLLHAHLITVGIDYEKKTVKLKPFLHQLNQQTGKIYSKYPRILYGGLWTTIERINYKLPSKDLVTKYEKKKFKFVSDLTEEFVEELKEKEKKLQQKLARNDLTEKQQDTFNLLCDGWTPKEIAKKNGITTVSVYETIGRFKKKGFKVVKN